MWNIDKYEFWIWNKFNLNLNLYYILFICKLNKNIKKINVGIDWKLFVLFIVRFVDVFLFINFIIKCFCLVLKN